MPNEQRRRFLQVTGGACAALAAGGIVGRVEGAETTTLSGRFVAESGGAVINDEVNAVGAGVFKDVSTDANGWFEAEVPTNARYELAFYKADSRSDVEGVKNGVPHVYVPGEYAVGESPVDVGEIILPMPSILDFRLVDGNGNALLGADVGYRVDGFGTNPSRLELDADGYVVIEGANFTGLEIAEYATLEFEPPPGDEYPDGEYRRKVSMDGHTTATATVTNGSVSWEISEESQDSTETMTATAASEPTTTEAPGTTVSTTTSNTITSSTSTRSRIAARTETPAQATPPKRGFISNGDSTSDLGPLEDPFILTVGGFALSVVGIAHQMVKGY